MSDDYLSQILQRLIKREVFFRRRLANDCFPVSRFVNLNALNPRGFQFSTGKSMDAGLTDVGQREDSFASSGDSSANIREKMSPSKRESQQPLRNTKPSGQ